MTELATPRLETPRSWTEALASIGYPEACVLGGGTMLYPRWLRGEERAARLIDISFVAGATAIAFEGAFVSLGPAVTYSMIIAAAPHPLLTTVARGVTGGPQIRNQGTLAGSACYANPASDAPTALCAADAVLTLESAARGQRQVRATAFFKGAFLTDRGADEALTRIDLPVERGAAWGYAKFKSAEGAWPIAVAAAKLTRDGTGGWVAAVTIGASVEQPIVSPPIALKATSPQQLAPGDADLVRQAVRASLTRVWSDELADASYRARIAPVTAVRAIQDALSRGQAE